MLPNLLKRIESALETLGDVIGCVQNDLMVSPAHPMAVPFETIRSVENGKSLCTLDCSSRGSVAALSPAARHDNLGVFATPMEFQRYTFALCHPLPTIELPKLKTGVPVATANAGGLVRRA